MNDRAVELLEQYDIEVLRTRKGRGAFLCETEKEIYIFKEYTAGIEHALLQKVLSEQLAENGFKRGELVIPTKQGELLVQDREGTNYILKTWHEGRECSLNDRRECQEAVRMLARMHKAMEVTEESLNSRAEEYRLAVLAAQSESPTEENKTDEDISPEEYFRRPQKMNPADVKLRIPPMFVPGKEYDKHIREMRRVRKYLKSKGQKQPFEKNMLSNLDFFLEQAISIAGEWEQYSCGFAAAAAGDSPVTRQFCHGEYQHHNLLLSNNRWYVTNFEKCLVDDPIRDLCLFLRKLLEKTNWSPSLGEELLQIYEKERPLSDRSRTDLYCRLAFPEKFWKIVNFYFNSGKAWIPWKYEEKLENVLAQEDLRQTFLAQVFRSRL